MLIENKYHNMLLRADAFSIADTFGRIGFDCLPTLKNRKKFCLVFKITSEQLLALGRDILHLIVPLNTTVEV